MIKQFKDQHRWLSNFWYYDKPMKYGNLTFTTNEHFFVAMKTMDNTLRKQVAEHPLKGLKALGSMLPLRDDWEEVKLNVMLYGLRYKFSKSNPSLREKLIVTGDCIIEEGNWFWDQYWGVDLKTGRGENHLGKLLMQVREEIKEGLL